MCTTATTLGCHLKLPFSQSLFPDSRISFLVSVLYIVPQLPMLFVMTSPIGRALPFSLRIVPMQIFQAALSEEECRTVAVWGGVPLSWPCIGSARLGALCAIVVLPHPRERFSRGLVHRHPTELHPGVHEVRSWTPGRIETQCHRYKALRPRAAASSHPYSTRASCLDRELVRILWPGSTNSAYSAVSVVGFWQRASCHASSTSSSCLLSTAKALPRR